MNVDVAVDPNKSLTGCGSILRDAEGNFISARAALIQISLPPNEAEASDEYARSSILAQTYAIASGDSRDGFTNGI